MWKFYANKIWCLVLLASVGHTATPIRNESCWAPISEGPLTSSLLKSWGAEGISTHREWVRHLTGIGVQTGSAPDLRAQETERGGEKRASLEERLARWEKSGENIHFRWIHSLLAAEDTTRFPEKIRHYVSSRPDSLNEILRELLYLRLAENLAVKEQARILWLISYLPLVYDSQAPIPESLESSNFSAILVGVVVGSRNHVSLRLQAARSILALSVVGNGENSRSALTVIETAERDLNEERDFEHKEEVQSLLVASRHFLTGDEVQWSREHRTEDLENFFPVLDTLARFRAEVGEGAHSSSRLENKISGFLSPAIFKQYYSAKLSSL
jgi:hypothetical protein